jgi:hypothetical protein
MNMTLSNWTQQAGGFLLEALIGILIFAFGVLGIVGLQAHSLRVTNESQYRAEALTWPALVMSEMWTDDYQTLANELRQRPRHRRRLLKFKNDVKAKLGNAWVADPELIFDAAKALVAAEQLCEYQGGVHDARRNHPHQYVTSGVIGQNP